MPASALRAGSELILLLKDGSEMPASRTYAEATRKQFDRAFNEKTRKNL